MGAEALGRALQAEHANLRAVELMVDAIEQLLVVEPDELDPDNLASTAKVSTNTSIVSTATVR